MKRSLRSWLWRVPVDEEIDDELSAHLEVRVRDYVARGMDPAEARDLARRRLGDIDELKRTLKGLARKRDREMRVTLWFEELRDDVKFAVRQLRHSPAFTLVAAATLALGIGANSAMFALVDATVLRPLPYREPDRLVALWETSPATRRSYVSPLDMRDWNERTRTFAGIAGFVPAVGGMVMAGADGNAETVSRQWVTAGIFDVFGVAPIVGRSFTTEDETTGRRVVMLSEPFWRARFNGDPSIVGTNVRLDGDMWTIVGVMPRTFDILGQTSMWAMRPIVNLPPQARGAYALQVVGRMKPGVTPEAAADDLSAVAAGLSEAFPKTNKGRGAALERLHEAMVGGDLRRTSMLFLGVVAFVLLICCANVAALLLARGSARVRELAVRSALGAGRRRIFRQLLTESIVLALLGGGLGAGLGVVILGVAPSVLPEGLLPATVTLVFDARVVAFCAVTAIVVGVLFGVMPAFRASDGSPAGAFGAGGRTVTGAGGRLRALLVTAEVATAVLLLFGATLLLRTLLAVDGFERGYRAGSVLSLLLDPLGSKYPTPESLQQFYDQVEAETLASPNVAAVAYAGTLPLDTDEDSGYSFEIVGDAPLNPADSPGTDIHVVSDTYFSTLDLPILAGRAFDRTDRRDTPPVCIANEALARAIGGRDPVGRRVALRRAAAPNAEPSVCEIVGVARQVKGRPDEMRDFVELYVPMRQNLSDDVYMVVTPKSGRAASLAPTVRAAVSRVDREQLVSLRDFRTLDDIASRGHSAPAFPGGDGRRLRRAGARARDGGRVRHPRVFGAAARPRLRRAPRARRDDRRRAAPRRRNAARRRVHGRRDRSRPVGRDRPVCSSRCSSACGRSIR